MDRQELYCNTIIGDIAVGFEADIEVNDRWELWNLLCQLYRKNGYSFIDILIAMDITSLEKTIHYLSELHRFIRKTPHCKLVHSIEEIQAAKQEGALAILFSTQGTNMLNSRLDLLPILRKLGIRRMVISYNLRNSMGDGCTEPNDAGLSQLGKKLILEMNKEGIIADCSHVGVRTSMEIMELSKKPVVFSHSNPSSLCSHSRGISDQQIQACAKTGGLIGINSIGILLGGKATVEAYLQAIDYIVQKVGYQHVAIGSDFLVFPRESYLAFHRDHASFYPDNYLDKMDVKENWESLSPNDLDKIIEGMVKLGYKKREIQAILGENYLRILEKHELNI